MAAIVAFTITISLILTPTLARESACLEEDPVTQSAYFGWPVKITCEGVRDALYFYDEEAVILVECTMMYNASNETFFNVTFDWNDYDVDLELLEYEITNVAADTPTEIVVEAKGLESGGCAIQKVTLLPTQLPVYTCEDASKNDKFFSDRKNQQESQAEFLCEIIDGSGEPEMNTNQYNVTWYYNCGTNLPLNVTRTGNKLEIGSVDYKLHSGVYTCSIQENGQERFLISHHFCIEPRKPSTEVAIHCPEEISYDVGDTVNVTCNIADGLRGTTDYFMSFYPLLKNGSLDVTRDNISCTSWLGKNKTYSPNGRASCVFSFVEQSSDPKCFNYTPTELEWEKEMNKTLTMLQISYEINDTQAEDAMALQAYIRNEINNQDVNDTTIIELKKHPENTALIVGLCIGGFLLILLIVAVCIFFRLQIRYWWRQSRWAKYENDVRKYGAYFSYYWENKAGEQAENEQYQQLIRHMKKRLQIIGCPIYDTHEAPALFQWNLDNVLHVQNMCDRVVVILTPEYIRNRENYFELFTNFLDSTFVFIKAPGVDKALGELAKESRTTWAFHLKRNYVINWSGQNNERLSRNFQMKLELAMPKRRPNPVIYQNGAVQA